MRYWLVVFVAFGCMGAIVFISLNLVLDDEDNCRIFMYYVDCIIFSPPYSFGIDIVLVVSLAIMFYILTYRNDITSHKIVREVKKLTTDINNIVLSQKEDRDKRKAYAIQSIKNHFASLTLCIGIANQILHGGMKNLSDEERAKNLQDRSKEARDIVGQLESIIILSYDVMNPLLTQQINKLVATVRDQVTENLSDNKPIPYDEFKKQLTHVIKELDKETIDLN